MVFLQYISMRAFLFVCCLFASVAASGQELTVYVIPPNIPMNWRSPGNLLVSYMQNLLVRNKYVKRRHPMGHVLVELKDPTHYAMVGMVAESKQDLAYKVYAQGYGLGILVSALSGKMEEGEVNTKEVAKRCARGDIAFIHFGLSSSGFERLWAYLEEYKQRGYDKVYGGDNKPREGKGAGCSAFAVSFIELDSLLPEAVLEQWRVRVQVPCKLIGGPEGGNRWVGLHKILLKHKWADTTRQRYRNVVYYEPTLLHQWILNARNGHDTGIKRVNRLDAPGVEIDRKQWVVPEAPVWLFGPGVVGDQCLLSARLLFGN